MIVLHLGRLLRTGIRPDIVAIFREHWVVLALRANHSTVLAHMVHHSRERVATPMLMLLFVRSCVLIDVALTEAALSAHWNVR